MRTAALTRDDLFTLRDAILHAEEAHATDIDPTIRQKYIELFNKIGAILNRKGR